MMLADGNESREELHDRGYFQPGDVVVFTDEMPKMGDIKPGVSAIVAEVNTDTDALPFPITVNVSAPVTITGLPVLAKEIRLLKRAAKPRRRLFPWQ